MRFRRSVVRTKRRMVRWGSSRFFGDNVVLTIPPGGDDPSDIINFWMRWPTANPDPNQNDFPPEEETWIKCFSNIIFSHNNGGAQASDSIIFAAGLIAWDAIDPLDFGITTGIFPPPSDGNFDWIWRTTNLSNFANVVQSQPSSAGEITYVSSAMRKLPPGTGVVGLISATAFLGGTFNVSWAWDVRYAVKVQG